MRVLQLEESSMSSHEPVPIYTDADGVPLPGHPGPRPDVAADLSERVAWVEQWTRYMDSVRDRGNAEFARAFRDAMAREEDS
jgi:hypothetical protein